MRWADHVTSLPISLEAEVKKRIRLPTPPVIDNSPFRNIRSNAVRRTGLLHCESNPSCVAFTLLDGGCQVEPTIEPIECDEPDPPNRLLSKETTCAWNC